jgi:Cof subfamily protein (haloacid dehalogenase superfamily)
MSPPGIRLLLSDVDGTLVTQNKILTPRTLFALRDLREAGVAFAITSSRPPRGMRMLIAPLELRTPLAGFNGGLFVNPDLTVIARHTLDPDSAKTAVALLEAQGLDVWIYTESDWVVRRREGPHVAREAWILQFEPTVVAAFSQAHLDGAIKIVGVSDNHDLVAACEVKARESLGPMTSATRSEPHFLDITNAEATKGFVVLTLAKQLGISPAEIATIGDMPNDVLMFVKSGLSVAMGNASDEVKAQATHVTATNAAEGFAIAVRDFVLPAAAPAMTPTGRDGS